MCHHEALYNVRDRRGAELTDFQEIIIENQMEIRQGAYSAQVLIGCGALADALTVLPPAMENMLDIQYPKRWPRSVASFHAKAKAYDEKLATAPRAHEPKVQMGWAHRATYY
jgi:hypothetical protein